MTLFVAFLLPGVSLLGNWQLERGAFKRGLETQYLAALTQLPKVLRSDDDRPPFTRVRLTGRFVQDQYFLVDNQVVGGRVGYWLIHVFHTQAGRFLVNRGFIAGGDDRAQLPEVVTPSGQVSLVGMIWPFTGLVPLLEEDQWADGWPKRVQRLDAKQMAAIANAVDVEIRLEPGQPGVDDAAPFAAVLSDAKHRGYAATWFGLGIALTLGYLVFGVMQARAKHHHPPPS